MWKAIKGCDMFFFNIIINSVEFKLKIILIKYDIFLLIAIKSFTKAFLEKT